MLRRCAGTGATFAFNTEDGTQVEGGVRVKRAKKAKRAKRSAGGG